MTRSSSVNKHHAVIDLIEGTIYLSRGLLRISIRAGLKTSALSLLVPSGEFLYTIMMVVVRINNFLSNNFLWASYPARFIFL
jgi:hypothetical protein